MPDLLAISSPLMKRSLGICERCTHCTYRYIFAFPCDSFSRYDTSKEQFSILYLIHKDDYNNIPFYRYHTVPSLQDNRCTLAIDAGARQTVFVYTPTINKNIIVLSFSAQPFRRSCPRKSDVLLFLMMDNNRVNEPSGHGVTSLEGLYTDFDGWVARYNSCYKRSKYFSKEISTKDCQIDSRQNGEDILEKDIFFGDSLLRHRHLRRSAKTTPYFNFYKENDGFVSFDHVFYRLVNKNGDSRIVFQYIRSKL